MKRIADLTEAEVLALAITNDEEDGRIYLFYSICGEQGIAASALTLH